MDLYLKTNVSGDKYEFWRTEVVGKVKWSLKRHTVGKNTYLALHIVDPSGARISHETAKLNRHTMRTLGNVTNLPNVEDLLFQMSLYNGWRKIERFLDDLVRAI
ncbi:MAG: hypothetical protein V3U02_02320 [Calditrichia bacterium]